MNADVELTLIENGEILSGGQRQQGSLLTSHGRILQVGEIDGSALALLGVPYEIVDAADFYVLPGLVDPHEHLAGGSGEKGFQSATPPIFLEELVRAGITSVVGTLGVDTTTTVMAALLARVKALRGMGLSAWMYSGGYEVPPATVTGTIREDLLLIDEVIGMGEISISDDRSTDPDAHELARIVNHAFVAGRLSGKAGVSHFHVGPNEKRLSLLRQVLDEFDARPEYFYPTHVERSEKLMDEAIEFVKQGTTVDIDVVEKDLPKWLRYYADHGGDWDKLSVSTDSFLTGPQNLFEQVLACVDELAYPLEKLVPLVTQNAARVLKLAGKGRLERGADADLILVERSSRRITDCMAGGRWLLRDNRLTRQEPFFQQTDRRLPRSANASK
jgi:beta-aspartyl-dipeptidase (metallo-type)